MYTLLLDSSNNKLAVGIASNGKVLKSVIYDAWQRQSEVMVPEIDNLLKEFEVKNEEIECVMCAIGPGSYTGVRIALTIAKVMALALNIALIPVSSLQVLKDGNNPSICLINARSNRSYFAVYEGDKVIEQDQILTNEEVKNYIEKHPDYVVCGDTKYLNVLGKETNTIEEMYSLKNSLKAIDNSFALKPVYMKD